MKKFYCDACDSAFEAETPETGTPKCPKCGKSEAVGEPKVRADDCLRYDMTVAEFHSELKKAIGQDTIIDEKAHEAATSPKNDLPNPTPAQMKAGTYRKGHITVAGFDIAIENPEGSERKGIDHKSNPWSQTLKSHYGYLKRTQPIGNDGDHVDVFVRPGIAPDYDGPVFVVYQLDHEGYFDEHKVMLGWPSKDEATAGYLENYQNGQKKRVADVQAMTLCDFADWLKYPDALPWKVIEKIQAKTGPALAPSIDSLAADSIDYELLTDAKDGLCRIRQLAMVFDAVNKNGRLYPLSVGTDAIREARKRARAGSMLSEFEHPAVVDACDRGKCGEKFVDDPFAKTARVDDIEDPDENKRAYIVRTILDTEGGRKIKAKVDSGQPLGISTRFGMTGRRKTIDGKPVDVADSMVIHTFDDVRNPAVQGAGAYTLLSDCQLAALSDFGDTPDPPPREDPGGLGEPFQGEANNTINPPEDPDTDNTVEAIANGDDSTSMRQRAQEQQTVKNTIKLLRDFRSKVKAGACADVLDSIIKSATDGIRQTWLDGETDPEFKKEVRMFAKSVADAIESIPAFYSGKPSPVAVLANEIGEDLTTWGEDLNSHNASVMVNAGTPTKPKENQSMMKADTDPATTQLLEWARNKQSAEEAEVKAKADAKALSDSIEEGITALLGGDHEITRLDEDRQTDIVGRIRTMARSKDDVVKLADSEIAWYSKLAADAKKAAAGLPGAIGNVVLNRLDPQSRAANVSMEAIPVMASVEKLLAATDEWMESSPENAEKYDWVCADGDSDIAKDERRRRAINRRLAMPIIEQFWGELAARAQMSGRTLAVDSIGGDSALSEFSTIAHSMAADSAAYNTVLTNLANQPTLMMWLLVQAFQDMRSLEFVTPIGPGVGLAAGQPGWQEFAPFGRVFRVPSESYTDPSGFPSKYGVSPKDLQYPTENVGIIPGGQNVSWQTFGSDWRMIAEAVSLQSLTAIGLGPLNYPAISRGLYHMAARKCRSVDTLLLDEIMDSALEFNATVQTVEAYTTGGTNGLALTVNSVMPASGAVTVNLNPQKTLVATVASTDKSRTYGTGTSDGGTAPVAALRLKAGGGNGAVAVAGTYSSLNQVGPTPVVRPRSLLDLTGPGADSTSTLNAITVSVPVSQVQGWLGRDGNIYSFVGTTATFAVDWLNGIVLFNNTLGDISGSGTVITTSISVAYSYATNFDYFVLGLNNINEISLATGEKVQDYYSRLLGQIDQTAAALADAPNYVKPDCSLWGVQTSSRIVQATQYFKLNSPDGTALYPDETYFSRRNGVNLARFNAQAYWKDQAGVMFRKGTTRYAINQPAEIRGPVTLFDGNGRIIPGEAYWLAENSAICTPQVKDANQVILNGVAKAVLTY